MNALELAAVLEKDPSSMVHVDAAEMLCRQVAAIRLLREALIAALSDDQPYISKGKAALAATENLT
jgi:hypothetical protein